MPYVLLAGVHGRQIELAVEMAGKAILVPGHTHQQAVWRKRPSGRLQRPFASRQIIAIVKEGRV